MTPYTHVNDLVKEAQPHEKGILSGRLFNDEKVKAVIFGFCQGEELSEHTASMPAVLHSMCTPSAPGGTTRSPHVVTPPCGRSPIFCCAARSSIRHC